MVPLHPFCLLTLICLFCFNAALESKELEPSINDMCNGATPLEIGVAVDSNTLAATGDPDLPFCGE